MQRKRKRGEVTGVEEGGEEKDWGTVRRGKGEESAGKYKNKEEI